MVVQQFLAEAQAARALEHPSLVRLLGLVEIQGAKAAVTEYVEGFDLATFLARNKRISIKQSVDLLTTLADAFGYAHERRLLHRDLKPANILVGKAGKLKIAGFGLGALRVRELDPADGYPSPEFLGGAPFGIRSDIYALGALIFHALTGQNPGAGVTSNGSPPRLRQILPEAPGRPRRDTGPVPHAGSRSAIRLIGRASLRGKERPGLTNAPPASLR